MQRNYFLISSVLVLMLSFLNTGATLKNDNKYNVIAKTQTDPITHKEKTEELKEGVKGAPTPSFQYYGSEQVLSRPPIDTEKEEAELRDGYMDEIPDFGETIPENLEGIGAEETEEAEDDWWFEDWADLEVESEEESNDFGI